MSSYDGASATLKPYESRINVDWVALGIFG